MILKKKNTTFQSCRYCYIGGSLLRVDSEEGTFYICQKHKDEKDFLKDQIIEGAEEEFSASVGPAKGVFRRAVNYVKGV